MEIENIAAAVTKALPTTFVAPLSGIEIPNANYAPPAQPTAEEIAITQAQRIAELEAALNAADLKSRNTPVVLPDGSTMSAKAASMKLSEMSVAAQVAIMESQRYIAELAARAEQDALSVAPLSQSKRLLTLDSAEALFGREGWKAASNETKAKALDARQCDLDKLKVEDYFGPGTSRAAAELSKSNPGLYKLLRAQAVKKGILA